VRSLLVAAGAASAGIVLAVSATGGTYAYLNSAAATGGAVLQSGNAALAVTALSLPTPALYPGRTTRGSATVTNTGTIPLKLRVAGLTFSSATSAFSSALVIGAGLPATGTTVADCANAFPSTWSGTRAAPAPAPLNTTLAAGASVVLCVSVTLPTNAPDAARSNTDAAFVVTVDGSQL